MERSLEHAEHWKAQAEGTPKSNYWQFAPSFWRDIAKSHREESQNSVHRMGWAYSRARSTEIRREIAASTGRWYPECTEEEERRAWIELAEIAQKMVSVYDMSVRRAEEAAIAWDAVTAAREGA